jgi:hypothetical protein
MNFGIQVKDHPGLNREAQVRALAPYLDLLSSGDIYRLWAACNKHGWFDARRELLDNRLQPRFAHRLWNAARAEKQLDKMIAERHAYSIRRWIDQYLNTDVRWSEILDVLVAWLDARRSTQALEVVANALIHRGTRDDLRLLKRYEGMLGKVAKQLLAGAEFAVRRRTIH